MKRSIISLLAISLSMGGIVATSSTAFAQKPLNHKPAMGFHRPGKLLQKGLDRNSLFWLEGQAKLLGITVEDLKTRQAQGKTFQQIAQDLGLTPDQLKARRIEQMKAMAHGPGLFHLKPKTVKVKLHRPARLK